MSWRHVELSIYPKRARRLAVARPKLSGRRSSSTVLNQVRLGSVYRFCVASLWEDPECWPEELKNGLDWCRQNKDGQRKTDAVDGMYLTGVADQYET